MVMILKILSLITKGYKLQKSQNFAWMCCTTSSSKRSQNLLHALKIVKKNVTNFRCILIGLGMEKKNKIIRNLIKKFNLDKEISPDLKC